MIWKILKKNKLNSEKIWKIWKKNRSNCKMIWKIGRNPSEIVNMKNMEEKLVE